MLVIGLAGCAVQPCRNVAGRKVSISVHKLSPIIRKGSPSGPEKFMTAYDCIVIVDSNYNMAT